MNIEDALPCPTCGSPAKLDAKHWRVYCPNGCSECNARFRYDFENDEEAIASVVEEWNNTARKLVRWTKVKPNKGDYYWCKFLKKGFSVPVKIIEVVSDDCDLLVVQMFSDPFWDEPFWKELSDPFFDDCMWAGPIREPEENI